MIALKLTLRIQAVGITPMPGTTLAEVNAEMEKNGGQTQLQKEVFADWRKAFADMGYEMVDEGSGVDVELVEV